MGLERVCRPGVTGAVIALSRLVDFSALTQLGCDNRGIGSCHPREITHSTAIRVEIKNHREAGTRSATY